MTIGFVGLAGLGLAGALAVIDWIAVARANERLERRAKPAVMAILIAAVLISDPDASPRSVLLAIALATSLTGDWLLLPPVHFEKGLLAFFFAHLAYLGALLVGPLHPELALVGAAGAVAVLLLAGRPILAGATRAGILGWDRFVGAPPATPQAARIRRLAVIVSYHCGQLLLTAALLAAA